MAEVIQWPPQHRCENCGWWRRIHSIVRRLLMLLGKPEGRAFLGRCRHPNVDDITHRSYVCFHHTSNGKEDIRASLLAQERMRRSMGLWDE